MISKTQYRRLQKMVEDGENMKIAASKCGIDRKTARKYVDAENPFEKLSRHWRTRTDTFQDVWPEIEEMLERQPLLEAKTLFFVLQENYPGRFQEGQLRTFQRRVSKWKALKGKPKEVFFEQVHHPGDLSASDFTSMNELKITIAGCAFPHLVYHFVLTYSNWESVTICYSETLESLSEGLQNALWQLGGVPKRHRSDRLSAAIKNLNNADFTARYEELLTHYRLQGEKTQPRCPHENGDVEQAHFRLKRNLNQMLMIRGSRDFESLEEYQKFLQQFVLKQNIARKERCSVERDVLNPLPEKRLAAWSEFRVRVSRGSTIRIKQNTYSVPSSLIGKQVEVRLSGSALSVWYQGSKVEEFPRLTGRHKSRIDYRHVIEFLIRKPGAFENYRYREEFFPTTTFRIIYDILKIHNSEKEYLKVLKCCVENGESRVERILKKLLHSDKIPSLKEVEEKLARPEKFIPFEDVNIPTVDLGVYDQALLGGGL